MANQEVVYFELNNWFRGENYPDAEPFISWVSGDFNHQFRDEQWCKDNKLCVVCAIVDMSQNYTISATKEWVEQNCPELLTKYDKFIRAILPIDFDEDEFDVDSENGPPFLYYSDDNLGLHYCHEEDNWEGYSFWVMDND